MGAYNYKEFRACLPSGWEKDFELYHGYPPEKIEDQIWDYDSEMWLVAEIYCRKYQNLKKEFEAIENEKTHKKMAWHL